MKLLVISIIAFISFFVAQLHQIEGEKIFKLERKDAWGYEEVHPEVHLFWLFYFASPLIKPLEFNPYNKPLLIWLGFYSTADTNFNQYGPLDSNLQKRNYSLVNDYNILFIDSMAGAGFSYVENDTLYAINTHVTSYDLLMCIKKFFLKFSNFKSTPTYIVADSFFGKIVPELADLWQSIGEHENIQNILQGIVVGNPLISPLPTKMWNIFRRFKEDIVNRKTSSDYVMKQMKTDILLENWQDVYRKINDISGFSRMLPDFSQEFIRKHLIDTMNDDKLNKIMNEHVKSSLKLKSSWEITESKEFLKNIRNQIMKPILGKLFEKLLNTTRLKIIILNTQLDLKIDFIDTLTWVEELKWKNMKSWDNAKKVPFNIDNKIIGFMKNYDNLYQYVLTENLNLDFETNSNFLRTIVY